MNPKVAVLLCVHNGELFIRETIESILNQTYKDFEFIIVENCSTDNTWQIIKSYTDHRIRAFQTNFKQLSFNLNYGLMQTKAEYIARMDADDIAKPKRLEHQIAYLKVNPDIDVLGTAYELFGNNDEGKIITLPATDKAIRRRLPFRFCFCHPSVIFKRETILNHGGYQGGKYCQDADLWLRLSRDKTVKFANLQESLLKYRIHPNQAKGQREVGIIMAGQVFREALVQKSPRMFLGFLVAVLKLFRPAK
jgi:glycosyltransferase involved in cell wall biosynthesis